MSQPWFLRPFYRAVFFVLFGAFLLFRSNGDPLVIAGGLFIIVAGIGLNYLAEQQNSRKPPEPAEPTEPTEPVQPTPSGPPAQPTSSAQPIPSVQTAQSAQPVEPVEPSGPAEPSTRSQSPEA